MPFAVRARTHPPWCPSPGGRPSALPAPSCEVWCVAVSLVGKVGTQWPQAPWKPHRHSVGRSWNLLGQPHMKPSRPLGRHLCEPCELCGPYRTTQCDHARSSLMISQAAVVSVTKLRVGNLMQDTLAKAGEDTRGLGATAAHSLCRASHDRPTPWYDSQP